MVDEFDDVLKNSQDKNNKPLNIKEKPEIQTAIALNSGDKETGYIPQIMASGRGEIAEQILQLAFENDIKVREDSALAQILAKIDIDSPIPTEAFGAVAEILSYVYRANGEPNPFDVVLEDVIKDNVNEKESEK